MVATGIVVFVVIGVAGWWALRPDGGPSASVVSRSTVSSTTVPVTTTAPTTSTSAPTSTTEPPPSMIPAAGNAELGNAEQVIVVSTANPAGSQATLTAYEKADGSWQTRFGPWDAVVGTGGIAQPGAKREGDGRTPSGSYGFDFFFGTQPDPGVHFPYRQITGPSIVWDDDPSSANYNRWVDTSVDDAGVSPEPMDNSPAYDYGAVIAYNTERTPGLGSAIFLHVAAGTATAGCVAVPQENLLELLRWLDPARNPRIVIRTSSQSAPDVTTAALER